MYEKKAELEKRMKALWEEVKDRIPVESYVVDFAVMPDKYVNFLFLFEFFWKDYG